MWQVVFLGLNCDEGARSMWTCPVPGANFSRC